MTPEITVIIRSRGSEDLSKPIKSVLNSSIFSKEKVEIIVVSFSNTFSDLTENRIRTIKCPARRIEAKAIGINVARGKKVLFLDSDQTIAPDLIPKILEFEHDMGIVPERSQTNGIISILMNKKRIYTEARMREKINLSLPVIPRIFRKELMEKVFHSMDSKVIKYVTETEDSIIFYEAMKYSNNIGWIDSMIFNEDPSLKEFIKKSYSYGRRNEEAIVNKNLGEEYIKLIRKIQFETLFNNGSLSPSIFVLNVIRGVPYLLGSINSRFKRG